MNKIIEVIKDKVKVLLEESDTVIHSLEEFGWKDNRPQKTSEQTTGGFEIMGWDINKTTPATTRIPPTFIRHYQQWYASCLAIVEANIPSRLSELRLLHEGNKTTVGIHGMLMDDTMTFERQISLAQHIRQMAGILASIPNYIEARLYNLELAVAQAYVTDELVEAHVLLKAGHTRAAGGIAGVLLERHLRLLCDRHQPPIKYTKTSGISKLNDALKETGVYDVVQWRKVQWMGDIRNSCDHANKTEPRPQDVDDLIAEVKKFVSLFVL